MTKEQYARIFLESHPGFLESDTVKNLPEEEFYEEMFLPLSGFSAQTYPIPLPDGITFGYYDGDRSALLRTVGEVDGGWPEYFDGTVPVYCAFARGKPASFCLIEDMGPFLIDGRRLRVGGPGCVGTVPRFRRQGIGLAMVRSATEILQRQGFDYSYIHYTGVASWYAKLGYRTELRWNRNGIL